MKSTRMVGAALAFVSCCVAAASTKNSGQHATAPIQITIDARDLPRKLIHAELTLPLASTGEAHRKIALWYPKWVPGSHGPGGPIANVAGLKIEDTQGNQLNWLRTPGEVFRLQVQVPGSVQQIRIFLRYIADQPTTTSYGHDCFSGTHIGMISPGAVLIYPETIDIDTQKISTQLRLPADWRAATALPITRSDAEGNATLNFQSVTLRTFVDSPIMCGRHYETYDLVEKERRNQIPEHTLHVFADDAKHADLNDEVVAKLRAMVTQTALLMESHPFDRFDILLGVSDELPRNGLEHSRSTFNVLPPKPLQSLNSFKGWDRLLIPHEYIHAWCGKYRRPSGMLTQDFHSPKDTELLWVYEGLTQYLGELIEARCGLMSPEEFRHRVLVELRRAVHQQGRQWRTLADTAAASHILRAKSSSWSGLRRSQDYYMEGMLFWLEADALIRQKTNGSKSLDDFCRSFLGSTSKSLHPSPFTRQDIVRELQAIAKLDWDGLIRRRVESYQQEFDPTVASLLGYEFKLQPTAPQIPDTTFRHQRGVDVLDSLGMVLSQDGEIQNLLIGSLADRAQLGPGMKIIGVNSRTWSQPRLIEVLTKNQDRRPIELLVAHNDQLRTVQLHYHDGPRHWSLVRQEDVADLLADILKAK